MANNDAEILQLKQVVQMLTKQLNKLKEQREQDLDCILSLLKERNILKSKLETYSKRS